MFKNEHTHKIVFILSIIVLSFLISPFWYSFLRYQKILHNESCGKTTTPCVYEIVPPSLWELIADKSSIEMRPPCNPYATTTNCVPALPPPVPEATTTPQIQTGKIDEHLTINNTLRDVNFCGKIYKVKQIIIDGVDVVQRIAELVRNRSLSQNTKLKIVGDSICKSVPFNPNDELQIDEVIPFIFDPSNKKAGEKTGTYGIYAQIFQVGVNPTKNEIYGINGFDGNTELIGKLK